MAIIERENIRNILVIAVKRVGELLVTTPMIRALKKSFPNSKVYVVCDDNFADVLRRNPYIDSLELLYPNTKPRQVLKMARYLRKQDISVAIDVLANPRSAFLTRASGASIRIGPEKRVRKLAYTHYLEASPDATPYVADLRINAARLIAATSDGVDLDFFTSPDGEAQAIQLLAENQIAPQDTYIAFAPISLRDYKRWPFQYFAQVADTLRDQYNLPIVLVAGPGESPQLEQMQREMESPPDALIECQSLDVLGSLLKLSELVIANDIGIKHLAVAVKTKTVAIFGYGDRLQWDPNDQNHISLSAAVSCRKPNCYRTCKFQYRCLSMVKPEEVIASAKSLLDNTGS